MVAQSSCSVSFINGFVLKASSKRPAIKPIEAANKKPNNSKLQVIKSDPSIIEKAATEIRNNIYKVIPPKAGF